MAKKNIQNTYVLVANDENRNELVEPHIFTRKDVDSLGFSVNPTCDDGVIAITVKEWSERLVK